MSKGVIYARSAGASDNNINGQLNSSAEFARGQGLEVTKIYIDKGKSGTTMNRPALKRLLADAKAKKFDAIISTDPNRLARSSDVHQWLNQKLGSLGVKTIFANPLYAGKFDTFYSLMHSKSVKRGMRAAKARREAMKK